MALVRGSPFTARGLWLIAQVKLRVLRKILDIVTDGKPLKILLPRHFEKRARKAAAVHEWFKSTYTLAWESQDQS